MTGLLLIAHGSRRAEANRDLEQIAALIRHRGPYSIVRCAYLELASPDIATAAAQCVADGATRILLLPYFLSAGTHVADDLEAIRQELVTRYPNVSFRLCDPIGPDPLLADIIITRARQGEGDIAEDQSHSP